MPLADFFCVVDQMPTIGFSLALPILGHPALRHLQGHRVDVEARERVVAGLGEVAAVQQVEDAQVEEERVLGLAGERLHVFAGVIVASSRSFV